MNLKNQLRFWIKNKLEARGYGARARLAEYLNLTPMQISNTLNTTANGKNRNIQGEELLLIMRFFGVKVDDPFLSLEDKAPASPLSKNSDCTVLLRIYNNATPSQRRILMGLIRTWAESNNIRK